MTEKFVDETGNELTVEQWLAIRKEAGLLIDPATADVMWCYAETLDPYGVKDIPEEYRQVGREYFARAPGSDIWVLFEDLPEETAKKLWEMHQSRLTFPAGLFAFDTMFHADGSQDDLPEDLRREAEEIAELLRTGHRALPGH